MSSAINLSNPFGPRLNLGPVLELFVNEKNQQTPKEHANLPSMPRGYDFGFYRVASLVKLTLLLTQSHLILVFISGTRIEKTADGHVERADET